MERASWAVKGRKKLSGSKEETSWSPNAIQYAHTTGAFCGGGEVLVWKYRLEVSRHWGVSLAGGGQQRPIWTGQNGASPTCRWLIRARGQRSSQRTEHGASIVHSGWNNAESAVNVPLNVIGFFHYHELNWVSMVHKRDILNKNTVNDAIQFKSLEGRRMKMLLGKKLFLVTVNVDVHTALIIYAACISTRREPVRNDRWSQARR